MLAFFYFKMAKNMPRVMAASSNPVVQIKEYRLLNWLGSIFNVVFPLIWGIFFVVYAF